MMKISFNLKTLIVSFVVTTLLASGVVVLAGPDGGNLNCGGGQSVNNAVFLGGLLISGDCITFGQGDETYVVMTLSPDLTLERKLTAGTGLSLTDGGANANATLGITNPTKSCAAGEAIASFNLGNANPPVCLPVGGGSALPAGTSGQTLRYDSSNALVSNSNIFNTGASVGIGVGNSVDGNYKLTTGGIKANAASSQPSLFIENSGGGAAIQFGVAALQNCNGTKALETNAAGQIQCGTDDTSSGGSPIDAQYVVMALNSSLSQDRKLTAGTGLSLTDGGANNNATLSITNPSKACGDGEAIRSFNLGDASAPVCVPVSAGGSPIDAQYVVMALNGGLTQDRKLTAGTGLSLTDGGANGNATLNLANPTKTCAAGEAIASFNLGNANPPVCLPVGGGGLPAGTRNAQTLRYNSATSTWVVSSNLSNNGVNTGIDMIGTAINTDPNYALTVSESLKVNGTASQPAIFVENTGGGAAIQFGVAALQNCNGTKVLETNAAGQIQCGTDDAGSGGSLPAGTINQTLRYNGTAWVANSNIYNTGAMVGIATSSPTHELDVNGSVRVGSTLYVSSNHMLWNNSGHLYSQILSEGSFVLRWGSGAGSETRKIVMRNDGTNSYIYTLTGKNLMFATNHNSESVMPNPMLTINTDSSITIRNLAGTGTRMVVANASGVLGVQAIPGGGGGGTVTSVSSGVGLSASPNPITTSGSISLNTAAISACTNSTTSKIIWDSANNRLNCATDQAGAALPSGSSNQTLRHNGTTWVSDSNLYNNGTNVGIGTTSPSQRLHVNGTAQAATFYASTGVSTYDTAVSAGTMEATQFCLGNGTNCITSWPSGGGGGVSGTVGKIAKFTAATTVGDSLLTETTGTVTATGALVATGNLGAINGKFGVTTPMGLPGIILVSNGNNRADIRRGDGDLQFAVATGTGAPTANMTLSNSGTLTVNKVTTNTIDPVYLIGGKKYATYVADFAGGVRTETAGVVTLGNDNRYVINFANVKEGSNLWLFWHTSDGNLEGMTVSLTAGFNGKAWYQKEGSTLTIYGDTNGEVSYSLSAPRVDHKEWSNSAAGETIEGIDVSKY